MTSDKNPATHAYGEAGLYKATVTATTDDGTATASVEVIVTSGEGGTKQVGGDDLYIRDMVPPKARLDDDEACDGIEVVFETTNMVMNTPTLDKKVPGGTWESKGGGTEEPTGVPGLRRWVWGWPTWGEKNWGIEFRVQYRKPPMPGTLVTVGPKTFTVTNTVVNSPNEVLVWDGVTAVNISWTISHCAHRDPMFNVGVVVMTPSRSSIRTMTLTNVPPGSGSTTWDGKNGVGVAVEPGIYLYSVSATHIAPGQTCTDTDKATALAPQVTGLHFTGAASDALSGHVEYTMNRDAASCFARIYGQAPGGVPQQLGGDVTCADATQGTHTSNTFTVTALRDPNGHPAGTYWAVVFATETVADGQTYNRDQAQKPAVQHGVSRDSPVRIKSISFLDAGAGYGANNEHDLWENADPSEWGDGPAITDPVWIVDGPDEGTELDKNQPACYTRSVGVLGQPGYAPSRIRVSVTVRVDLEGGTFNLVGLEDGTVCFRENGRAVSTGDQTVTMLALEGHDLPTTLEKLAKAFTWQVELQGTTPAGTFGLGSSSHTVYVVYATPILQVEGHTNYPTPKRLDLAVVGAAGLPPSAGNHICVCNAVVCTVASEVNDAGGNMPEDPRWKFYARSQPDRNAWCDDQAALACSALGVVGIQGYVHKVFATCADVPEPYPGEPRWTTNDYVSNYRDMRLKTKDVGGTLTALVFEGGGAHEGCLRVEDGSAGDGNQWWTVWPLAAHDTAEDLLIWFVEDEGHAQRWLVNGVGYLPGTVDIPKDLIYPCPKILGGPD